MQPQLLPPKILCFPQCLFGLVCLVYQFVWQEPCRIGSGLSPEFSFSHSSWFSAKTQSQHRSLWRIQVEAADRSYLPCCRDLVFLFTAHQRFFCFFLRLSCVRNVIHTPTRWRWWLLLMTSCWFLPSARLNSLQLFIYKGTDWRQPSEIPRVPVGHFAFSHAAPQDNVRRVSRVQCKSESSWSLMYSYLNFQSTWGGKYKSQ